MGPGCRRLIAENGIGQSAREVQQDIELSEISQQGWRTICTCSRLKTIALWPRQKSILRICDASFRREPADLLFFADGLVRRAFGRPYFGADAEADWAPSRGNPKPDDSNGQNYDDGCDYC
jgi:hypothetical protein